MNLRSLPLWLAIAILGFCLEPALAAPADAVQISFQIFRIRGNVSGDTSLTDNVWAGTPPKGETEKALSFFTTARLTLAGHTLELDPQNWRWDGKPLPLGAEGLPGMGDNVLLIATPRLKVPVGENAAFELASDQAIDYFVPRGNGLFELKVLKQRTGLSLNTGVRRDKDGRIHLEGLALTSRMVESRKPLEGTSLNVGEPVVSTRELKTDVHLKTGADYGFFFFTRDGQGTLLVRLRIDPAGK